MVADHFARGCVDDGDVVAAAVEGPDGLRGRLKDDAVGVLAAGRNGGDRRQRGAVEDDDGIAAAVGDVAEFAGLVERDAVRAVQAGDGADQLAGGGVDHQHVRAARNVEPVRSRVGGQIVPSAIAADLPFVDHVVRLLRLETGGRGGNDEHKNAGKDSRHQHAGGAQ